MDTLFDKNRNRESPDFANINLLGHCNVNCFFCLGKDLKDQLKGQDQRYTPPSKMHRLDEFLALCKRDGIKKIYITGQNVDSLQYQALGPMFSKITRSYGLSVGVRTNGYEATNAMIDFLNYWCDLSVGYSIHTLNCQVNKKIMGRFDIPRWDNILTKTVRSRVSIVVNKWNVGEFEDLVKWISQFPNVKYIQARRISTDARQDELREHVEVYEDLYDYISASYPKVGNFYDAEIYEMFGKHVCFWRTVKTSINSYNYFSDGTISKEYFVVEGYLKNRNLSYEESTIA